MVTKAELASKMKKAGIPIPPSAKVGEMQHRLRHWLGGDGFLVRLLRNPSMQHANHPITLLGDRSQLYWLPNSSMAHAIVGSRLVLVLERTNKPSNDAVIIEVPSDYDSRWGSGGNASPDS